MVESLLVLDDAILNWVLIPIVIVVFLVSILRTNISKLVTSERVPELKTIKEKNLLERSKYLRAYCKNIPYKSFEMRKKYFEKELHTDNVQSASPMSALMDPYNMKEMVKKNMAFAVSQMLLLGWVNHFFSGFLIVKLPFPLTLAFKTMLQRGMNIVDLDPSYVSALSWYFLTITGLRGINSLIFGPNNNAVDAASVMNSQMKSMQGPQVDMKKLYQSESDELALVDHDFDIIENAEIKLLKNLR
eukprot:TRINITY_DN409_c0_g1_i1.p1 TRINITY_DN409_c0_g1~~TRINITY_DN409_c0_g1_i1.p1  ORF type:complete len:245 (+),score=62.30 TRINITY_DN409_c0_g1_i1:117-851(+)